MPVNDALAVGWAMTCELSGNDAQRNTSRAECNIERVIIVRSNTSGGVDTQTKKQQQVRELRPGKERRSGFTIDCRVWAFARRKSDEQSKQDIQGTMRTDDRSGNGVRIISRNSKQERYYARSPSNKTVNRVKINPKHREQEDSNVIYYCYPASL